MIYRVERKVDGEWYWFGTYTSASSLARCMWDLGHRDDAEEIRVEEVNVDEESKK